MRNLGGTRVVALVVAAVLGVSGGIFAAFVAPSSLPTASAPEIFDPLDLGVALEDVDCTGESLIAVGWGDTYSALVAPVRDWAGVKYLRTSRSCPTAYPELRGSVPRYVAYLPPYDKPEAACAERMNPEHKGDFVTRMREGNEDGVPCACETELSTLPAIGEGQELTTESGMWIYLYQGMLNDIAVEPAVDRTGLFDADTLFATLVLQTDAALNPSGIVDADTWDVLRGKACRRYVY